MYQRCQNDLIFLLILMKIYIFASTLSSLCVNLGTLNIDNQAANAELKNEKSKQLS